MAFRISYGLFVEHKRIIFYSIIQFLFFFISDRIFYSIYG